jgi:hypothetical protein
MTSSKGLGFIFWVYLQFMLSIQTAVFCRFKPHFNHLFLKKIECPPNDKSPHKGMTPYGGFLLKISETLAPFPARLICAFYPVTA